MRGQEVCEQGRNDRYIFAGVFPCTVAELVAVYAERKRRGYGRNIPDSFKHAENDIGLPLRICDKSVLRRVAVSQVVGFY